MPEPTMQELLDRLKTSRNMTEKHLTLIYAIQNYEVNSLNFRQLQGRSRLPYVTAGDKARLMELHREIGSRAEELLKDQQEDQALREVMQKITALSSANYKALLQYDPAKAPKTLSSLEEDVRTLTVYRSSKVLLGTKEATLGNTSTRRPMTFLNQKGNRISGVFTKKDVIDLEKQFCKCIDETKQSLNVTEINAGYALDALKAAVSDPKKTFQLQRPRHEDPISLSGAPGEKIKNLVNNCLVLKSDGTLHVSDTGLSALCNGILNSVGIQNPKISEQTWELLAQKLDPVMHDTFFKNNLGKIQDKSRLDNRNAAMSTVADLLGMPSLIARSIPMKLIDENGQAVEGTFMEAAEGILLDNLPPEAESLTGRCLENTDGRAFKDISNLQVLDYICGNYDRHAVNIAYRFDRNGKLAGVQGIDNDSSFGALVPSADKNVQYMTAPNNMRVIHTDTAKRVLALDEATLKYALRGYGLHEAELDAAAKRLRIMKGFVTSAQLHAQGQSTKYDNQLNHLEILTDKDFQERPIEQYLPVSPEEQNTFFHARTDLSNIHEYYSQQQEEYSDLRKAVAVGVDNRANAPVPGLEREKARRLDVLLGKRTWFGFTSGAYEAMRTAVRNYVQCYKQIEDRLNRANNEELKRRADYNQEAEAVVTEADLNRMVEASKAMQDAAKAYLEGKLGAGKDIRNPKLYPQGASNYAKARIDAAREVLKLGQQGSVAKDVERQTARDNQRSAEAARQRRVAERGPAMRL